MDELWLILFATVGGLIVLVAGLALIGLLLPKTHVASRQIVLAQPREKVWRAITDFAGQMSWRADLKAVERLDNDHEGHPVWREKTTQGMLALATIDTEPPHRLTRKIIGNRAFGGRWEYVIVAVSDTESVLRITEHGEVYNPVFRVLSRFFNQAGTIENFMRQLAGKFDEPPRIGP